MSVPSDTSKEYGVLFFHGVGEGLIINLIESLPVPLLKASGFI